MIDLKLNWFVDDEPAEEEPAEEVVYPDVPDIPGVGGVLTAWAEESGEGVVLHATFKEILDALNSGWIVGVFNGAGKCDFVGSAEVDETGEDPVYVVETIGGDTYEGATEEEHLVLYSAIDGGSDGGGGSEAPK